MNKMTDPFQVPRPQRAGPSESWSPTGATAGQQPLILGGQYADTDLPQDFVTDTEHPVVPIPFKLWLGEHRMTGFEISVAAAYVVPDVPLDASWHNRREVARIQFDFEGFGVTIYPEVVVAGTRDDGALIMQFMNPTGQHLPQLRHIINSTIAGDFVSMGGLMSYSGPTKPKGAKAAADAAPISQRIRSIAVAVISLGLILSAANFMYTRATQTYELRPVLIERQGSDMRATTAGQIAFLNPQALAGEVVFSINSVTGDVLNFQLPCDCEVAVTDGIFEGATVLPIDVILSFFESSVSVRAQTLMSIEGLAQAMDGYEAYLDVSDGRSIPVQIVLTSATNAASARGDLFVPVNLRPEEGALSPEDIGKTARLRLARTWFDVSFFKSDEET